MNNEFATHEVDNPHSTRALIVEPSFDAVPDSVLHSLSEFVALQEELERVAGERDATRFLLSFLWRRANADDRAAAVAALEIGSAAAVRASADYQAGMGLVLEKISAPW